MRNHGTGQRGTTERRRTAVECAIVDLGQHLRAELDTGCTGAAFHGSYETWLLLWLDSPFPLQRIPQVRQALTILEGYDATDLQTRERQARLARDLLATLFRPETPLDRPLWFFDWISVAAIKALSILDIFTVRDLLYHLPRRYDDRSLYTPIAELKEKMKANVIGLIVDQYSATVRQTSATVVIISDGTARLRVIFSPDHDILRMTDALSRVAFTGTISMRRLRGEKMMPTMFYPKWIVCGDAHSSLHTGGLIPIHPLTKGVSDFRLREYINTLLTLYADSMEHLPEALRVDLLPLADALRLMHFPIDENQLKAARKRLAFDELLVLQLGIIRRKTDTAAEGRPMPVIQTAHDAFLASLPFALTPAQEQAVVEIADDMSRPTPMLRLLQGDVGSGKTAVALYAAVQAIANGYQVALMAPTELLAEQHLMTLRVILGQIQLARCGQVTPVDAPTDPAKQALYDLVNDIARRLNIGDVQQDRHVRVEGLVGRLNVQEKRRIQAALARGEIDVIVGTQALISRMVRYANLGLVIVDEQHRFGVDQRRRLAAKGFNPHILMLTATPIPRTTVQIYYGEIALSVLRERPPGRRPIKTLGLNVSERDQAYVRVRAEVQAGRQAFVICPVIEEHEDLDWPAAEKRVEELRAGELHGLRIEVLHGRMHEEKKEDIMRLFRDHELDVLVSTQVVEVGIDIPNATVIVIEGADRFGIAQLHQLRGRVGRGQHQSYCYLVSDAIGDEAVVRLRKVCETDDGFALARADLNARGPGEFFGDKQSGAGDFQVAKYWDWETLHAAQRTAHRLLAIDPDLVSPEHAAIAAAYRRRWEHATLNA